MNLLGIDIGGTKCAVIYGKEENGQIEVVGKIRFATTQVDDTLAHIEESLKTLMSRHALHAGNIAAAGISCGGPLDSKKGLVQSPPNLPGWDNIPIVDIIRKCTGVPTGLQNDANACALAEYKYGAGRGCQNMVFLTFGTGLGAGIIINGKLYSGTNDNAGELGHIRLAHDGPIGYGKKGSFEGFCSGGGIAQLAKAAVTEAYERGDTVAWCRKSDISKLTAQVVAQEAQAGDTLAQSIFRTSSEYLGMGLSMVVDILNPEVIVIGSIYARNEAMMRPVMDKILKREALPGAYQVAHVVPALLGEQIGDYASLSVASATYTQTTAI